MTPHIWRIGLDDCPPAAELLARAFQDDLFFQTCIPDADKRRGQLPPFFAACLRYGCHFGRVYAAGFEQGRMEGVGWWYRYPESYYTSARADMVGFGDVANLLGDGSDAIQRISGQVDDFMARSLPEPRANLDQIGVDPDSHGRGIGSALVQQIVADAQAEGLPVALWTDAQSSLVFYERNGFQVAGAGQRVDFEIDWWVMFRDLD